MTAPADLESPLEHAAHELATQHRLGRAHPVPITVLNHLPDIKRWLEETRQVCVDPPPDAGKAAEWLLDNDYQVYRALRRIDKDLPPAFYRQLSALRSDKRGIPRVYDLAAEYLRASHMQVSLNGLAEFVEAYQQRLPLKIAEVWALPTMLRIACVEHLVVSFASLLATPRDLPFSASDLGLDTLSLDPTERVARSISNLGIIASIPWEDFFDRVSVVEEIA